MQFARAQPVDAENVRDAKALGAKAGVLPAANSRRCAPTARQPLNCSRAARSSQPPAACRALGDIGNLVGGFNQKVHVGKDGKAAGDAKEGVQVRRARPAGAAQGRRACLQQAGAHSQGQLVGAMPPRRGSGGAAVPAAHARGPPLPRPPRRPGPACSRAGRRRRHRWRRPARRPRPPTRRCAGRGAACAGQPERPRRRARGADHVPAARVSRPPPRRPAPQAAAKPRVGGLRPRDSSVPVVSAQAPAAVAPAAVAPAPAARKPATRRSMSQALQDRSEMAVSSGKPKAAAACPPSPLPDIDSCDAADPLAATDFVTDIFGYYKRMEPVLRVSPDYMVHQVGGRARAGGRMGAGAEGRLAGRVAAGGAGQRPARRTAPTPAPPPPAE